MLGSRGAGGDAAGGGVTATPGALPDAAVVIMEDITDLREREAQRLRLLEEERGAKVRLAIGMRESLFIQLISQPLPRITLVALLLQASSAAKSE